MNEHAKESIPITFQPQTAPEAPSAFQSAITLNKRRLSDIFGVAKSTLKFHWTQLAYGMPSKIASHTPLRDDALAIYTGYDEKGLALGGNPHWKYFSNPFENPAAATDAEKYRALRAALSTLPAGPQFRFHATPILEDKMVIRSAFVDSGFTYVNRPTFLCKPVADNFDDLVKQFKSDARSNVRQGKRDLEITSMNIDDFFELYEQSLADRGEQYRWFPQNLDKEVLRKEMERPDSDIEIVAARRKSTPENPGPHPIDAAILRSRGNSDGYSKFLRVTYRIKKEDDVLPPPHTHAIKLVVTEIMLRAAKDGVTIDTDGFTAGGERLYSRFGILERHDQDIYTREGPQNMVQKVTNKVASKVDMLAARLQ
jgi:hypothetical protein